MSYIFFVLGFVVVSSTIFLMYPQFGHVVEMSTWTLTIDEEAVENAFFVITALLGAVTAFNLVTGFKLLKKKAGVFSMLVAQGLIISILICFVLGWVNHSQDFKGREIAAKWDSYMAQVNEVREMVLIDTEQVVDEFVRLSKWANQNKLPASFAQSALIQAAGQRYNRNWEYFARGLVLLAKGNG